MSNPSKVKNNPSTPAKAQKKTINFLPILALCALVLCAAVVLLTNGNGGKTQTTSISTGGALVIPTSKITSDASFYPVVVDGTEMEVIAVRDSGGNIRTAFNTCQVCYDSGRGYYVQSGDVLVCQNCGNRFSMDQVGVVAGGCNPVPIFAEDRTESTDKVSISYDVLAKYSQIFANWKGSH